MTAQSFTPNPDKTYKIKTAGRGYWKSHGNGRISGTDDEAEAGLYAFIQNDSKCYIYSVNDKKFLCRLSSGQVSLEDLELSDITDVAFNETGNASYPVYFTDQNDYVFNMANNTVGYTYGPLIIDGWKRMDDGNQLAIAEAGDFDSAAQEEAQSILGVTYVDVVYNIIQDGKVIDTKTEKAAVGRSFPVITDFSSYWLNGRSLNDYFTYPIGTVQSAGTYDITCTRDIADLFTYKLFFTFQSGNYVASVSGAMSDLPTDVVIPSSITVEGEEYYVTSIAASAFSRCDGMASVTIPKGVTSIGFSAFFLCSELREIKLLNPVPPTVSYSETFEGVDKSSCTLVVPKGSLEAYQQAAYWNEFQDIIESKEDPDGLSVVLPEASDGSVGIFTLNGVRVGTERDLSKLPKGVYVVKGRKVVKK